MKITMLRNEKKSFDISFFLIAIALWITGNILVCSAVAPPTGGAAPASILEFLHYIAGAFQTNVLFRSQVIWTAMGIVIVLIMVSIPAKLYYKFAPMFYIATILLLVAVLAGGVSVKGAGRWIMLGGIKIQP
jgi:cell division protein FtsW (lipid II flippase)